MNGPSESESAKEILLAGLAEWIRLLKLPPGANYYVQELERIQAQITKDAGQIAPLLLSGEIWGGMGSFLDSAVPRYESAIPKSTDPVERAKEWEETHREMDRWHREFSIVTIQVGKALIDWCQNNGGIFGNGERLIEDWIGSAKRYLQEPYRPLEPVNIECLEHNMRFMQQAGPSVSPNPDSPPAI